MLKHFPGSRADQSGEDTILYSMISRMYSLKTIQMNRIYMQNRNKLTDIGASLVAHWWTHLPMKEIWVQSLGQDDTLEEEMATHSSIFAWRIPWTEDPGRLHTVHEVAKSQTQLSNWISNSPLELRESLGSWNIFSHKQEMGDKGRLLQLVRSRRILLSFWSSIKMKVPRCLNLVKVMAANPTKVAVLRGHLADVGGTKV